MAIADDFSVTFDGNIRHVSGTTRYTVLEIHRYLQDLADDQSPTGDDVHAIFSSTSSDRSTDNIITLNSPYNIDDTAAEFLYDGSILQDGGDTRYSGIVIVGSVETGTELMIFQGEDQLRNYWGTGINPDAGANILMRLMVKTRKNGVDIDGNRLRVKASEWTDRYAEFNLTAGLGNSTAAIFTSNDLNNQTAVATVEGWDTITNTEGLRKIDVDNDSTTEDYYSEWNRDTFTINQLYERGKWYQRRPDAAEANTNTGTDNIVDNATITGQGQEFTARDQAEKLTSCKFFLKVGLGTPTGDMTAELYDSNDAASELAIPTGAVLATSDPVSTNVLTASYAQIEFTFNDNVTLTASQDYFIVIRHADGAAGDYVHVRGDGTAGTPTTGNRASQSGAWTGAGTLDDLDYAVYSSPILHDMPGNYFRGVTNQMGYDTEAGTPTLATNEELAWGTLIQLSGITGTFVRGEAVHEDTATPAWKGEVLEYDAVDTSLLIVLESGTITGTDTFTGQESGATATADSFVAPFGNNNSGGIFKLVAFEDDGTDGELYMHILRGAAPVDSEILYVALDKADSLPALNQSVTVSAAKLAITAPAVSAEFMGNSTGSALIGAHGLGVEFADLSNADLLTDLTGTANQPPNNVQFDVNGLVSSEDYILVGPEDGAGGLDEDQLTLSTDLIGATETAVVCTAAIPVDTPASGTIRIQLDDGRYRYQTYTSYTGSTFTIPSTSYVDPNDATGAKNIYVSYIDKAAGAATESFTTIYNADRTLFVRRRDGGAASPTKTFEGTATLGTNGGNITVQRLDDA